MEAFFKSFSSLTPMCQRTLVDCELQGIKPVPGHYMRVSRWRAWKLITGRKSMTLEKMEHYFDITSAAAATILVVCLICRML